MPFCSAVLLPLSLRYKGPLIILFIKFINSLAVQINGYIVLLLKLRRFII